MTKKKEHVESLIRIRKDQQEWLKKHPEISLSALVRRQLDKFIAYYDSMEKAIDAPYNIKKD